MNSSDYEWLVLTNTNRAKFQGLATINGSTGLYPSPVEAFDGGSNSDRFIICIRAPDANPDLDEFSYKSVRRSGRRPDHCT